MTKNILIVDDEESVRYSFKRFLNESEYCVETAKNGAIALRKMAKKRYDLTILDVRLPDISGIDVLRKIKTMEPKAVVLIMTAFGTTEIAIEATKLGAYDYILKPFDIPQMKTLIVDALNCSHLMRTEVALDSDVEKNFTGDCIIGNSPPMQEVYKLIGRVAGSEVNVLLRGESGTGKELIARAIYLHSNRSQNSFLAVNCAAIPETLLESELFGYEKGAFTGANRRKIGKFEQANKGTLFLDEIGDMTLSTQAKLLRVLQEGCFEHLGGEQTIQVDVRLIAATSKNLEKAIEESQFREDLYYRIKVVTITLPPLRLHAEDIPDLVQYFLIKHMSDLGRENIVFSENVIDKLKKYHWPGNIRELENVIKRAIVLSKSNIIPEELITDEFKYLATNDLSNSVMTGNPLINDENLKKHSGNYYKYVLSETEKELISQVLQTTQGNQVQAAKILGISRVMLHDRMIKYGIKNEIIIHKNQ